MLRHSIPSQRHLQQRKPDAVRGPGSVVSTAHRSGHGNNPSRNLRPLNAPAGFTLLEVLVSLAILGVALTATSQLVSRGVQTGLRQDAETTAALLCRSKMDEVLAGIEPLHAMTAARLADQPDWVWSLEILALTSDELQLVTITFERTSASTVPGQSNGYSLTRAVRPASLASRLGGAR